MLPGLFGVRISMQTLLKGVLFEYIVIKNFDTFWVLCFIRYTPYSSRYVHFNILLHCAVSQTEGKQYLVTRNFLTLSEPRWLIETCEYDQCIYLYGNVKSSRQRGPTRDEIENIHQFRGAPYETKSARDRFTFAYSPCITHLATRTKQMHCTNFCLYFGMPLYFLLVILGIAHRWKWRVARNTFTTHGIPGRNVLEIE